MHLLEKLEQNRNLTLEEWQALIQKQSEYQKEAAKRANILREQNFSNRIYVRGLIEFTNYCRNDCYYCGIRKSNQNADRMRSGSVIRTVRSRSPLVRETATAMKHFLRQGRTVICFAMRLPIKSIMRNFIPRRCLLNTAWSVCEH